MKEFARLTKQNRHLQRVIQGYRSRLPGVGVPPPLPPNPTSTSNDWPEAPKKPEEPAPKHYSAPWQRYCTDCGEENPEFRDETQCKNCGMHLGAVEEVAKVRDKFRCPNCRSENVQVLEAGKPKARELKLIA